jgi:hypothetical protein
LGNVAIEMMEVVKVVEAREEAAADGGGGGGQTLLRSTLTGILVGDVQ